MIMMMMMYFKGRTLIVWFRNYTMIFISELQMHGHYKKKKHFSCSLFKILQESQPISLLIKTTLISQRHNETKSCTLLQIIECFNVYNQEWKELLSKAAFLMTE